MERRIFLKKAIMGAGAAALAGGLGFAEEHFPVKVDKNLFNEINRLKNPKNETVLEKLHIPVITAPGKVNAGEAFDVSIVIGKILHPMEQAHWIEYLQLDIGNEPAGTAVFRSNGYLKPEAKFSVVLPEDMKGKKVSLVATLKCNMHGIWQDYINVDVV